jgi:hypothetical protein
MLLRSFVVVCLISLVMLVGCGAPELPMEPSSLSAGIILYEHANFLGNSAYITGDVPDLRKFKGPCVHDDGDTTSKDWSDCVSSIRVSPGWRATVYRDPNYRDDALEVTADVPNLQLVPGDCPNDGLNDCISSVQVRQQ